jgi:hypothetical protein
MPVPDPHDSLIPVLILPVVFIALFLSIYFITRLFINKNRYSRWKRISLTFLITVVVFIIPGNLYGWQSMVDEVYMFIYLTVMIVLNALFSVWYKR